MDGFVVVVVGQ